MVGRVELIPLSEGNRITVKENEKVIVGRGSSLGCNEKKISRHHAELLLKDDNTLWIKPTHANPVFYRPSNGKTIQLPKDIERELKDGDQIGLLPSSFYFRVSFSTDVNNNNDNNDSDTDSLYAWKKEEKLSPVRATSPDQWSGIFGFRHSTSNQDISVFDFDDDLNAEPIPVSSKRLSLEKRISSDAESVRSSCKRLSLGKKIGSDVEPTQTTCKQTSLEKKTTLDIEPAQISSKQTSLEKKTTSDIEPAQIPSKQTSLEKTKSSDVEPKPCLPMAVPSIILTRVSIPSPSVEDQNEPELNDMDLKSRKLPKWMAGLTPSPVVKPKSTTPKSSHSRNSSSTAQTSAKRHLSFEGASNDDISESSNMSDTHSPATPSETKSPGKVLSRIPAPKNVDTDTGDGFDSVSPKSPPPPPPPKKTKRTGKRRPICQFGASCYRKNPIHRAEHCHPGDSDYEDSKTSNDTDKNDNNEADKPECPFGKSCYRQNPQHKLDFKH